MIYINYLLDIEFILYLVVYYFILPLPSIPRPPAQGRSGWFIKWARVRSHREI